MTHHFTSLLLLIIAVTVLGCGGGNVPLKGRVVFDDDGSPLIAGTIVFSTPTMMSRGHLDRDGYFSVGTVGAVDGIPPGTYSIAFYGASEMVFDNGFGTERALLADKWYSPETSGKTVEIDRSTRNLEIRVTRP